jgi:Zn-dependent protease
MSELPEPVVAVVDQQQMQPAAPVAMRNSSGRSVLGWGAAAATVLAKGKTVLLLLKGLPFAKLLLTSGSMLVSMLAYAAKGGWAFGVGFVLLILVHELGHGYAMRRASISSGWPIFIPFIGALIAMKGRPEHPCIEADVAYAGPVAGTAASLVCAAASLWLQSPFLMSLAYVGFFLNLFNLVPFGFLDGGRVARVVSRKAWIVGAVILVLFFFKSPSPQLLLIAVLGGAHALRAARDPDLELVTDAQRRQWGVRYFGLCAFLGACVYFSHRLLQG